MTPQPFKASVQYDDLTGTAAADRADMKDAESWLKEQGLLQDGEFLIGVTLYAGSLPASGESFASVSFLLSPTHDHDATKTELESHAVPVVVRRVERDMPFDQFFSLFKRFKICLSNHGMLEGREYTYPDY